jgi:hypothetical protein
MGLQIITDQQNFKGNENVKTTFGELSANGDFSVNGRISQSTSLASGCFSQAFGISTTASGYASHAEGQGTVAFGQTSHSEGCGTNACGDYSHAEGCGASALGYASHAEGLYSAACGCLSHAEGYITVASGYASHAEGCGTIASGCESHAEGRGTIASGNYGSHAEGFATTASGDGSHAEGISTTSCAEASHAEGRETTASGYASHAESLMTNAFGCASHAEGVLTTASGYASHSEGFQSTASGDHSHAEGLNNATGKRVFYSTYTKNTRVFTFSPTTSADFNYVTPGMLISGFNHTTPQLYFNFIVQARNTTTGSITAVSDPIGVDKSSNAGYLYTNSGSNAHAEGYFTVASCIASHAEGVCTIASGGASHAEGADTKAFGESSHAEGSGTTASGYASHAEGLGTTSCAEGSHAEGCITTASGNYGSHAEGFCTTASGYASHTEGIFTTASGCASHAEGCSTTASGSASHAEGLETLASGCYSSHAEGKSTTASGCYGSHAEGIFTTASGNYGSHAEGRSTTASGDHSHAEGCGTIASGCASHAEGYVTQAIGNYSHAAGTYATAAHNRTWIWKGSTLTNQVSTTKTDQFMVSAEGGSAFFGNVGINTDNIDNALTVVGNISATGTFVLDTSSSNTAFRITQRGEGNVLTVEDTEHPDFSPFNIDKDGRVLTGSVSAYDVITAPGFRLKPFFQNIGIPSTGGGAGQRSGNLIFRASANGSPGYLHLAKARTVALENSILSAVQVGDSLGRISYNGYDGTDIIESSYTEAIVSSVVPGASSVSSHIVFNTSNSGVFSLPASERMRITANGNVGIGTTTPNEILTVSGNISASGTVYGSPISLLGFHASTNPSVLSPNWATLHFAYPNDLAAITTTTERGFKFPFNARIVAAALTVSVGGTLGAGMVDGSSLNILNKTTSTRTTLLSAQTYSSAFSTYNTDNLSINVDKNQEYTFQVVIPAHTTPPTTVRHTVNIYFIRI